MPKELEEYDLDRGISTVMRWMGRYGTTVGVTFQSGLRYELDDVPDAVWSAFVAQYDRAFAWWEAGTRADEKPHEVSVTRFYKASVEPHFPRWKVDNESGLCAPHNDFATEWEAVHGSRGITRLHLYQKDGRYRRHGHYSDWPGPG